MPELNTSLMRTSVRGLYDLQAVRIQMGNRLVANFRVKYLGLHPSQSEGEDDDAKAILSSLRESYTRIADGAVQEISARRRSITPDGVISTLSEARVVYAYLQMEQNERDQIRAIQTELEEHRIWTFWMKGVKGCGPLMAAVIISEINIHKAKYVSSLWRYCGLDVGPDGRGRSRRQEHLVDRPYVPAANREKAQALEFSINALRNMWVDEHFVGGVDANGTEYGPDEEAAAVERIEVAEETLRGLHDTKKSVTFSPFVKTKLIGVLGPSFLKSNSPYRTHYDAYKHRLECRDDIGIARDGTKLEDGRYVGKVMRHHMAIRYMVKQFLRMLYYEWRQMEDLPTHDDYHMGKLGADPHTGTEGLEGAA